MTNAIIDFLKKFAKPFKKEDSVKLDRKYEDIPHKFVKGEEFLYCGLCGASLFSHCVTEEHSPSNCPGDHGK